VLPNLARSIASAREEGVPGTSSDIGANRSVMPVPSNVSTAIATAHAIRVDHDPHFETAPLGSRRCFITASLMLIVEEQYPLSCH
jgi:hypothetical protein